MRVIIPALLASAVAVLAASSVYMFGRSAQRRRGPDTFALPARDAATALDRMLGSLEDGHAGETGLHLLPDNLAAFRARWQSARLAGRSLDIQYYYWKEDMTGKLLLSELVRAADRGVRVRLLLDDINAFGFDPTYLAMDSHPNVEVRLFNPSRSRTSFFRRGMELIVKYFTATRRMHNKCWIADGRVVIAGGRNIGDAYFDASRTANFRDIDIIAIGAATADAATVFDRYWNSAPALPIRQLHKIRKPKLATLVKRLAVAEQSRPAQRYLKLAKCDPDSLSWVFQPLHWSAGVEVLADPPEKAAAKGHEQWLGRRINDMLRQARQSIRIISPYFIPGDAGARTLLSLAGQGVVIKVLTNSLAATDVIAVHGAYSRYRRILARSRVALYELKPEPGRHRASLFGSRTASLHTKAFLIDGETGFIGSFNLDPRSQSINTEMGIVFRCTPLLQQLNALFEAQVRPDVSYRVSMDGERLVWHDETNGKPMVHHAEPKAPARRVIPATLIALLPIESQL